MKILYIYRHPNMGFSIGKVFRPIEIGMKEYAEVDSCYLPIANYSIEGLIKNIRYAQKCCRQKKYDIVHITGNEHYLVPFIKSNRTKTIVTVHDLKSLYVKNPIINFIKNIFFIQSLQFANILTCISEKTKEEVLEKIPTMKNKLYVIDNPIDTKFNYVPKRFNAENPIILHIGTKENKNLINTIKALTNIKCHLRIIGKLTEEQLELLDKYKISYTNDYNLTDEQIIKEYINCDIVNFPSLYEGFGMPIIEGQAIGRVVITSEISPMKEVANGTAVLVNPYDIESIRIGYNEAITNHESYINKGLKNVRRFQLHEIIKRYYQIYKSIL